MKLPSAANEYSLSSIDVKKEERDRLLKNVLKKERIEELKNENLLVIYYINDQGEIQEMDFSFKDDSAIKPEEIYKVEESLKKDFKFSFKTDELKGANFVRFSISIKFKDLI